MRNEALQKMLLADELKKKSRTSPRFPPLSCFFYYINAPFFSGAKRFLPG